MEAGDYGVHQWCSNTSLKIMLRVERLTPYFSGIRREVSLKMCFQLFQ